MFFRKPQHDIICIGSCSQDVFFPNDEYVVYETPEDITSKRKAAFEIGGKFRSPHRYEAIGGVAANISIGLARFGLRSACYTHMGRDTLGEWALGELKKESVAVDLIECEAGIKTDLSAIIVLEKSGDRIIFHNRDANDRLVVEKEKLSGSSWIVMSALNGEWKKNAAAVIEHLDQSKTKFALNPGQHNLKDDPHYILSLVARADIIVLNKDEAIELLMADVSLDHSCLDDERFLLKSLLVRGARCVGLTDGVRGAWATDGREFLYAPIHALGPVIDTTGAGDAFTSGFLASHIQGESLAQSLATGMLNSGGVVTRYGAIDGLQTTALRSERLSEVQTASF